MAVAVRITHWSGEVSPDREELWRLMVDQGLAPYSWSNGPHDAYDAHNHIYDKVIYVVSGSIAKRYDVVNPGTDRRLCEFR